MSIQERQQCPRVRSSSSSRAPRGRATTVELSNGVGELALVEAKEALDVGAGVHQREPVEALVDESPSSGSLDTTNDLVGGSEHDGA